MKEQVYHINNLENQDEAEKITQAVLTVWGVLKAEANPRQKTVSLSFDERMASSMDFEEAIKELGFEISDQ